jgi:hypothetical protein
MLRKSLASLPQTLDQTYDRILSAISEDDREYAIRILQWLTFSARPLSVEEVAEVVAIDIARDPAFDRDKVLIDPLEALDICSSLVIITTNRSAQQLIALAHYSVQEYLVSDRIKQGQAKQYSMREVECQKAITKGSLKYLVQFQQPVSDELFKVSALARYSAEFWSSHLQKTGDEVEEVSRLAISLLSIERPAYLTWIRLYDPDYPWKEPDLRKSLESVTTLLYYAALLGLSTITSLLLNASTEVNVQGGRYGNALQAASAEGHEQVVKMLLEKGAEINAQGGYHGNALYAGAYAGNWDVLELLISKYKITQLQDPYNRTLLWWAAAGGQTTTVQLLISRYNYDPRIADKFGRTPLWIATKKGHSAVSELLSEECEPISPGQAASPDDGDNLGSVECDVCTSNVRATDFHYHCQCCSNGDWDVCEDCRMRGAFCADEAHILVKRTRRDQKWVEMTC